MTTTPLKTFICYARKDREALEALLGHLKVFERNGSVQFWYDGDITGGKDWHEEIRFNLKTADIVLLLVSPAFFVSDYIHSHELTEALQYDRAGEALVVPIILNKCLWQEDRDIARLQALPTAGRPIFDKSHWPDPEDGFFDTADGFRKILNDPATAARRLRRTERISKETAAEQKKQAEETASKQREAEAAELKRKAEEAARRKREAEAAEKERLAAEAARNAGLPDMVHVQGGTFQMGEKGVAEPVHPVTLSDFEIGKYPVTQKLWQEIMVTNPSVFKGCDDCPVESVSWDDVQVFLQKLNAKFPGKHYRLPTEAEWEYAARGGALSQGFRYAGSNSLDEVAWSFINSGLRSHPVGRKKANELDLHDMSGNVWEWCADRYHWDFYKKCVGKGTVLNPRNDKDGSNRVLRGGSADFFGPDDCRVAYRNNDDPSDSSFFIGFRLAASPPGSVGESDF